MARRPIVMCTLPTHKALKPHKRLLTAALLFISLTTGLSLWLVQAHAPADVASRVKQGDTLRVGFAVEAPYAFIDGNGMITGEAPEVFRRVAADLGVAHIDWIRMDFASLLPELEVGRIDAIAAGMFVTPERQRRALFSRPTATVRAALVVRSDEQRLPAKPSLADLGGAPSVRWIMLHDAVENKLLLQAGVAPEQIDTVPQVDQALRALSQGKADALAISSVSAWNLVTRHPYWPLEVRLMPDAPAGWPAFVFRLENEPLRDATNQALQDFLGSDEHTTLVRRFGFTDEELPPDQP